MPIDTEVKGLLETQRKIEQVVADVRGTPMRDAMRDATLLIQREAKGKAPVDTGRLRNSITPEVRMDGTKVIGVVGSNVFYAPHMEMGTGKFVGKPAYFPPPAALDTWARRHGMPNGFAVAMAIYKKGGLEGRRFLQGAFEENQTRIQRIIEDAVGRIVMK